jgi:Ca2+-binding EF-hand superfamily protein
MLRREASLSDATGASALMDISLDISDQEIAAVLGDLTMDCPRGIVPVEGVVLPPGTAMSSMPMVDFLRVIDSMKNSGPAADSDSEGRDTFDHDNIYQRIGSVINWCNQFWLDRENEENEAKKQRFVIDPSDLKRVVAFIDRDGSGSISIDEFREVFGMIKRAQAQRSMGSEGQIVMKRMLSIKGMTAERILQLADGNNRGVVTHADLEACVRAVGCFPEQDIPQIVLTLDPMNKKTLTTLSLEASLTTAQNELAQERMTNSRKQTWNTQFAKAQAQATAEMEIVDGKYSAEELNYVMSYMVALNKEKGKVGMINLEQLLHQFRRARRTSASKPFYEAGLSLMGELKQFLDDEHYSLVRWFNEMDSSFRKSHALDSDSEDDEDDEWYPGGVKPERIDMSNIEPTGTISALELKKGLTHLGAGFDATEVDLIMKFLDPDSDGELKYSEVVDGFRKLHSKTPEEERREKVGEIMIRVEDLMKEKGMRMLNVFQDLDKESTGYVSREDLMAGLLKMKEPNGKIEMLIKRKEAADLEERTAAREKAEKEAEIKEELARAEKAGVSMVLGHLEQFMKEKGLTVTTLCHLIDPDGHGEISSAELCEAVEKIMQPSSASRLALKKAREKEAAMLAKGEASRARARELMDKMDEMEKSGALICLTMLENYMRKNCLRIVDLFSKMDKSGDGGVNAEELRRGMKKCGLKMKRKDIVLFIRYVDTDGGGEISMEELNDAIRELRRFNWEKETFAKLVSQSTAPLPLRCPDSVNLWQPSSMQDGSYMLTPEDIAKGLMRMRGDGDDFLWNKYTPPANTVMARETNSRGGSRGGSRANSRPGTRGSRPNSRAGNQSPSSRPQSRGMTGSPMSDLMGNNIGNSSSVFSENGLGGLLSPSPGDGLFQQSTISSTSMFPPIGGTGGGAGVELDMASMSSEDKLRENRRIRDNTHRKMRKELVSKVKARAFLQLHIGVPVNTKLYTA